MILCSKISSMTEGGVDRHQMILGDDGQPLGQLGDADLAKRAEAELNDLIEARFAEKGGPYADAFRAVMGAPKNKAIKQAYAGLTLDKQAQPIEPEMSSQAAGEEVHRRSTTYMAEHDNADYQAAVRMVLVADPTLKVAYGQR